MGGTNTAPFHFPNHRMVKEYHLKGWRRKREFTVFRLAFDSSAMVY